MASARAEIEIAAPIDVVWATMIDTAAYPAWNPFIVEVGRPDGDDRPLRLGDRVVLHVRWHDGGKARATERVTALDPPGAGGTALLEYEYGGPIAALGLVRGRRQQQLTALADGATRYTTHENLRGIASRFAPIAKVQDGFERHAAALKAAAEAAGGP